MNVITKHSPDGTVTHCNAHCHNSTNKKCICLCDGLLHGKGESYAALNAARTSMYLNLLDKTNSKYFPAMQLLPDTGGR